MSRITSTIQDNSTSQFTKGLRFSKCLLDTSLFVENLEETLHRDSLKRKFKDWKVYSSGVFALHGAEPERWFDSRYSKPARMQSQE